MQSDKLNPVFEQVLNFINTTDKHIFLSGKAGTGKTTFLKKLNQLTFKKFAIVSPTGVAAFNAGGTTIHSLLGLPLRPYIPDNPGALDEVRFDARKKTLLRELELIVVDEVSMLRADVADAMDHILRKTRSLNKPFGGIQVLYIGDLFQLPPVVVNTWEQLSSYYKSPFFIDSLAFAETKPVFLELENVYRQNDSNFIELLNQIRDGSIHQYLLDQLNRNYLRSDTETDVDCISLTTHNYKANDINTAKLNALPGEEYLLRASTTGVFDVDLPVDKELKLKIGAQVMLLKNDKEKTKNYFNGKIGTVHKILKDRIFITFQNNETVEVERETWRNLNYEFDNTSKSILQTEVGTFHQFPVKLAWAITIHKSQGLTFDKAIIDTGEAFSHGQIYVALSRLRSLNGLQLKTKITSSALAIDPRIISFYSAKKEAGLTESILMLEQFVFLEKFLIQVFNWQSISEALQTGNNSNVAIFSEVAELIGKHQKVASKFSQEIKTLLEQSKMDFALLNQRIEAAVNYFLKDIEEKALKPLKAFQKEKKSDINYRRYIPIARAISSVYANKLSELKSAKEVALGLKMGKDIGTILMSTRITGKAVSVSKSIAPNDKSKFQGSTEIESLNFFKAGRSIDEIAALRGLTKATIENHLSTFIETREILITDIIESSLLDKVQTILAENPSRSIVQIRQNLEGAISFGQISAAIIYHDLLANNLK